MGASSAFGSPVVRKVNGQDVEFPRLTMRQYGQLEAVVKQRWRDVERALCDELQIAGVNRLPQLRAVEARPVLVQDVIGYLNSEAGTKKALALSVGETVAEEVMTSLPFLEANDLVGEIAGLGGVPPANPPAGATGGQTPPAPEQPASSLQI